MAQKTISANCLPLNGLYVIPLSPISNVLVRCASRYPPYNLQWLLDDRHAEMCAVVHQSRNIVFGHLWELLLEYAL